ncbi:MAG: InlB B-repeat-containing protein, partial [Butyrivibrio sp.]|nr:InlB B-repeat-containing protein [Butyrivibrio sp.]
ALEDSSAAASSEELSEELLIEEENDASLVMADTYSGSCGENATWKYDGASGTLTISGSGAMEDYKVLSTDSSGNVSTTAPWDKYRKEIRRISISQNITAIGDYSFYLAGGSSVSVSGDGSNGAMVFSKNLKRIGSYAFYYVAFHDITIPETVETIEEGAFYYGYFWNVINSSSFLKGVKKLGDNAFRGATFHGVTFDFSSAEYIGSHAFDIDNGRTSNCSTSFAFSDNLKYLGDYAFDGVAPKSSVLRFPSTMEYIGEYPFDDTESLKGEVVYPASLTKFSNGVFDYTGITSVIFGDKISEVSEHAFDGNNSLTEITFKGDFPDFKQKPFIDVKNKLTVYYPLDNESWFKGIDTLAYYSSKVEFVPVGDFTTVTFIGLDGKVVSTQKVALGSKLSDPTSLAANSSNIGGWYADRKLQYEVNKWDFAAPVQHKMTLYAGKKYTGHKVVFFPENGNDYTVQTVEDGQYVKKETPKYDGYRFCGWYTDRNYKHYFDLENRPVTEDVALYARWVIYRPYIVYDHSKYRYIPTFEVIPNDGQSVWDSAANNVKYYEKDGNAKFLGWFFDAGFKKPVPSNYTVTKDTRVYGKWELAIFRVNIDRMDGTEPEVVEVPYKELFKFPNAPKRRGYTFKGWSKNADGSEIEQWPDVEVKEDVTYYAVWEINEIRLDYYSVSEDGKYEYMGWDYKDACQPVEYGTAIEESKYHFMNCELVGWYYDAKLTKPVGNDLIYEDVTLYAKTRLKVYDVVIDPDNGEEPYIIEAKYGTRPEVEIPVKKGYEFTGWKNVDIGYTYSSIDTVTGPVSYEACWRAGYSQNIVISGVKDMTYTGSAIKFPELKITDNGNALENGKDYTLKYSNNVKVSTDKAPAVITISYKGLYQGKSTVNFKIKKCDLEELKKNGGITSGFETTYLSYNGKVQKAKPAVYLTVNGKKTALKENRDYRLVFENADPKAEGYDPDAFKAVGTYKIIAQGIGSYTG